MREPAADEDVEVEFAGAATVEIDLSDDGPGPQPVDGGVPDDSPSPDAETGPRGTFEFPADDPDFLQLLELRGNNGAQRDVETVYLLAGETYTRPTQLIALDDPAIYVDMTPSSVQTKLERIAEKVAAVYDGPDGPSLIAYAHTHPNGATRPSQQDRQASQPARDVFARRFDDFAFFNVIHALGDAADVPAGKMRNPRAVGGGVWWWGERRRHELAIYDVDYNPRKVVLV